MSPKYAIFNLTVPEKSGQNHLQVTKIMKTSHLRTQLRFRPLIIAAGILVAGIASAQTFGGNGFNRVNPANEIITSKTHLIVSFKNSASQTFRKSLVQRYGLQMNESRSNAYFTRLELNSQHINAGLTADAFVRELSNNPAVNFAELDVQITPDFTPNDPRYAQQWHLHNTGQTGGVPDADIDAPEAWDKFTGVQETVVAVCDDGVDIDHEDLAPAMWRNVNEIANNGIDDDMNGFVDDIFGWDTASNDNDPRPVGGASHGTHVAGITAGAHNNGKGISGVGSTVKIMAMRHYAGQGSWMSDLAKAIDYAWQNGADVITVSYNIDGWNQNLLQAVQRAGAADVVYLNSAGNNNQQNPPRMAMRDLTDNLIFVASTDQNDNRSGFSNWGSKIEVGAPGSNIMSTLPGNAYGNQSGTSMATPLAAGVVAVIRGKFPAMTAREALDHLIATSDEVPSLTSTIPGGKRVNLSNALGAPVGPTTFKSMTVIMGTLTGGNLASVADSDDSRVTINTAGVSGRGEYAVVEFVLDSPRTNLDINSMKLDIESAGSVSGATQFVTAYNTVTGRWDTLSSTRLGTTDGKLTVNVSKLTLAQYVDATTQEVKIRLQAHMPVRRRGATPLSFTYSIDQVTPQIN